jgi:multidrug efflux pump subunit AcrB
MTATPGVADVGTLQEDGLPEVRLRVDRDLVAHYGITAEAMVTDLSVLVQGNTSNQITLGEETLDVRVRAQNATLLNPKDLLVQEIATRHPGNGQLIHVPLMNIVDMVATAGPTLINRENRMRSIRLGARTVQGEALGPVIERLETALAATPFSAGVTSQVQGQSEQMNELFANLVVALGLGGIFVYMVLASLFESLLLPFVVMAAIPMAAIGALAALLIYGLPLDLYGGIGLVLLAGIVAKNSILLVDFAVARVREGQSPRDALLQSAPLRLRPILMTSLAMAAGMLPVALGIGSGGAARQSLGVATIGGIISSTLLTLLVVPSLYLFVERIYGRTRSMV